jgi:hypothetical protein
VLTSIQGNPAVPPDVQQQAEIELSSGVPFLSDADVESALEEAGVTGRGDVAEAASSPLAASWGWAHCERLTSAGQDLRYGDCDEMLARRLERSITPGCPTSPTRPRPPRE